MTRRKADAALALNAFLWGTTFVLVQSAIRHVSPLLFLAARFTLAAVALIVLFRGPIRVHITPRMVVGGCLTGVFLFAGFVFQTVGLRTTTAAKSAFITGLATVMVPLLGACVYKIRPQISELVGVLVATVGMGLLTLEGPIGSILPGDLLTLFASVAFAAHIVTLGHFSGQMGYELLSVLQIGTAAVLALSSFWWVEPARIEWQPVVVWAILITALGCTALAFTIQAWAQRYTTSTRTALIYALEPVFAWLTSYVMLGESLSGKAAAGAVLILGGVLIVEMKPFRPRSHLYE